MAADSRGHGHRRGQGRGGPDPQAVQGLRHAGHPHLHLHQQDGPGGPRPLRAVRGDREGAGHRHLPRQLAHRLRQGISRACTTASKQEIIHFTSNGQRARRPARPRSSWTTPRWIDLIGPDQRDQLAEEIELLDGAGRDFDLDARAPRQALPRVLRLGADQLRRGAVPGGLSAHDHPAPAARQRRGRRSTPSSDDFSAFVFKIQANMNKAHRDRHGLHAHLLRQVRARTRRSTTSRASKKLRLSQPQQLMAARAGDHRGGLRRGHHRRVRPRHLLHRRHPHARRARSSSFDGIPTFAPEHFTPGASQWTP